MNNQNRWTAEQTAEKAKELRDKAKELKALCGEFVKFHDASLGIYNGGLVNLSAASNDLGLLANIYALMEIVIKRHSDNTRLEQTRKDVEAIKQKALEAAEAEKLEKKQSKQAKNAKTNTSSADDINEIIKDAQKFT